MTDEKKSPPLRLVETKERGDVVKAKVPRSPRELVTNTFRDVYEAGQTIEGIGEAMKMGGVVLAVLVTLMSLASASSDGMSAFVTGVVVGVVAGAVMVVRCSKGSATTASSHHALQGK